MLYRVMFLALLVSAACGRWGFEDQTSSGMTDAPRPRDGAGDGLDGSAVDANRPDANASSLDGPVMACAYMSCPDGFVTCCDPGNPPQCIDALAVCNGPRYECTQGPPVQMGCTVAGDDCCLVCVGVGTECLNPTTEQCCG